jgi:hypothetical protein
MTGSPPSVIQLKSTAQCNPRLQICWSGAETRSASAQQARHRTEGAVNVTLAGELLRSEVARAAAEARAWVGGGADVPEAGDLGRVPGSRRQRAPEEVLVELCGAAVRIAGHRIGVVGDEVARGDYITIST